MTKSTDRVFLLLGPEQGEKNTFIKTLIDSLTKTYGGTPEITRFYPFETSTNHIVSIIKNGMLFSDHTVAILSNVESIKKKEELDPLLQYCKRPAKNATLLLISDAVKVDKRLSDAVASSAKKIFWELFPHQKQNWINRYITQKKLSITAEAAELLLELVENNTLEMQQECDKLTLFFPEGYEIEVGDVETYIYHSREENIFTLFEALSEKDLSHSLEILQKMLLSDDSQGIGLLQGVLRQYRKLIMVLTLINKSQYKPEEAFAKLNIRSKRNQKTYRTAIKNYNHRQLERIILMIGEYDMLLKEYPAQAQELLLSLLLYSCICDSCSSSMSM